MTQVHHRHPCGFRLSFFLSHMELVPSSQPAGQWELARHKPEATFCVHLTRVACQVGFSFSPPFLCFGICQTPILRSIFEYKVQWSLQFQWPLGLMLTPFPMLGDPPHSFSGALSPLVLDRVRAGEDWPIILGTATALSSCPPFSGL